MVSQMVEVSTKIRGQACVNRPENGCEDLGVKARENLGISDAHGVSVLPSSGVTPPAHWSAFRQRTGQPQGGQTDTTRLSLDSSLETEKSDLGSKGLKFPTFYKTAPK